MAVVEWMVHAHGVAVIPGSACGCPCHIRIAFGKPAPEQFGAAADRLHAALTQLSEQGFQAVRDWQAKKAESKP